MTVSLEHKKIMLAHLERQQTFLIEGATYQPSRDFDRLSKQARRVAEVMANGGWVTLSSLSRDTGDPEASVSARIRDIRKAGFTVEREYVRRGLWQYRLVMPPEAEMRQHLIAAE